MSIDVRKNHGTWINQKTWKRKVLEEPVFLYYSCKIAIKKKIYDRLSMYWFKQLCYNITIYV